MHSLRILTYDPIDRQKPVEYIVHNLKRTPSFLAVIGNGLTFVAPTINVPRGFQLSPEGAVWCRLCPSEPEAWEVYVDVEKFVWHVRIR